ncbi:MAG: hypothetical protein LBE35_09695 [Clostridiales bacterium]|jgi:hypothetical protein|nr:hypothetical protein [Clostridiales bacterium]
MVQFLYLERKDPGVIPVNAAVEFDEPLQTSGTDITYDTETGEITFVVPGDYHINWFVAQMTGLATDGSNFAIVTSNAAEDVIGSNHVKVSQTSGFAFVKTATANVTAKLVNASNAAATLSDTTDVKAALAVFGMAPPAAPAAPLGYFQAQVSGEYFIVEPEEAVDFDQDVASDPGGIITKEDTEFTLANPGVYHVTWEIPVDATEMEGFAGFTLTLNGTPHSAMRVPLAIGVVSGSAVVVTTTADSVLELVNSYEDTVRITEQANIVIVQIS